jgi:hypothetical protein
MRGPRGATATPEALSLAPVLVPDGVEVRQEQGVPGLGARAPVGYGQQVAARRSESHRMASGECG